MRKANFQTAAMCALVVLGSFFVIAGGDRAAQAQTTVNFGWEDGTSTSFIDVNGDLVNDLPPVAITPDTASVVVSNVSTGLQIDYGPSGTFEEPLEIAVTPRTGNRMLEVAVTPDVADSGTDAVVYLGLITGLEPGDTYSFSFYTQENTAGRSPSNPANATYTDSDPQFISFNTAFAVPLQPFIDGAGWVYTPLDENGSTAGIDEIVTYMPITGGDYNENNIVDAADYTVWRDHLGQNAPAYTLPNERSTTGMVTMEDFFAWRTRYGQSSDAVRLEANFFYQTATNTNDGVEYFYIDDLVISVTSASPTARIWLPDGTSVLVNPPAEGQGGIAAPEPSSLMVLALGLATAALGRRGSRRS